MIFKKKIQNLLKSLKYKKFKFDTIENPIETGNSSYLVLLVCATYICILHNEIYSGNPLWWPSCQSRIALGELL